MERGDNIKKTPSINNKLSRVLKCSSICKCYSSAPSFITLPQVRGSLSCQINFQLFVFSSIHTNILLNCNNNNVTQANVSWYCSAEVIQWKSTADFRPEVEARHRISFDGKVVGGDLSTMFLDFKSCRFSRSLFGR